MISLQLTGKRGGTAFVDDNQVWTSGHKGVVWHKGHQRYRAQIKFNGKKITIGHFKSVLDASEAYKSKAVELFGEYAYV